MYVKLLYLKTYFTSLIISKVDYLLNFIYPLHFLFCGLLIERFGSFERGPSSLPLSSGFANPPFTIWTLFCVIWIPNTFSEVVPCLSTFFICLCQVNLNWQWLICNEFNLNLNVEICMWSSLFIFFLIADRFYVLLRKKILLLSS